MVEEVNGYPPNPEMDLKDFFVSFREAPDRKNGLKIAAFSNSSVKKALIKNY
jgi:hypothetical protein